MTELIKVIVSIKDPFTLLAFFAVVLLLAFRTKTCVSTKSLFATSSRHEDRVETASTSS